MLGAGSCAQSQNASSPSYTDSPARSFSTVGASAIRRAGTSFFGLGWLQRLGQHARRHPAGHQLHAGRQAGERLRGHGAIEARLRLPALGVPLVEPTLEPFRAPGGQRALQHRPERRSLGQLEAQLFAERPAEDLARLDLLLAEQARAVERALGEDALAERVDGGDRRAVEHGQRVAQAAAGGVVDRPRAAFAFAVLVCVEDRPQLVAHALAHLAGGLVGEGDHQDLLERDLAPEDQLHHEMLERVGLARPGRRLDHRVAREIDLLQHARSGDSNEPLSCVRARIHRSRSSRHGTPPGAERTREKPGARAGARSAPDPASLEPLRGGSRPRFLRDADHGGRAPPGACLSVSSPAARNVTPRESTGRASRMDRGLPRSAQNGRVS